MQTYIQINDSAALPKDSVSHSKWLSSTQPPLFVVSSWDGTLRVYEVTPSAFTQTYILERDLPITCFACTANASAIFLGMLNGKINGVSPPQSTETAIGAHMQSVRSMALAENDSLLCSFDVGNKMKVTDLQQGQSTELAFDYRISCVDFKAPLFAVGFVQEQYAVFTLNDVKEKRILYRASPLGTPASCIELHGDRPELLIAGYDGRVTRVTLGADGAPLPAPLIFKATFSPINAAACAFYQVNCLAYCPQRYGNCMFSAGGNGKLQLWQCELRRKYRELDFKGPVLEVRVHGELGLVLVCTGYDWSQGVWGLGKVNYSPNVFVYQLREEDFSSY